MAKRYAPEVRAFIAANVQGRTFKDLAELVNNAFGLQMTENNIKAFKKNNKLRSGTPCGIPAGIPTKQYPKEVQDFIKQNYIGITTIELTNKLNNALGTSYTKNQIRGYKKNHKLKNGLNCRFEPGHEPFNKGVKGYYTPGSVKGWFKYGHAPHNKNVVGAEVVAGDGYIKVKIAEPNVWKQKHVLIWEAANGEVPKGKKLIFLDGNRLNVSLENLALVSDAELLMMNRKGLIKSTAELTKIGVMIARVNCRAFDLGRREVQS